MTVLMSEQFPRKFTEKARLSSRSLPEIKRVVRAANLRHEEDDAWRVGGEKLSITSVVNAVLAVWATRPIEEQDRVVSEGARLCNERLASKDEIPLEPSSAKPPKRK